MKKTYQEDGHRIKGNRAGKGMQNHLEKEEETTCMKENLKVFLVKEKRINFLVNLVPS